MRIVTRVLCYLSCFLPIAFGSGSALGTTIVEIRTPDEVVIAADSLGTFESNSSSATQKPVCKIRRAGNFYFAVAGIVNDPDHDFDIQKLVGRGLAESTRTEEALKLVEDSLAPAVLAELPPLKDHDPAGYAKLIKGKRAVSIVVATIDRGVPIAEGISVGLSFSPSGSVQTETSHIVCPGDCPNGIEFIKAGEARAIDDYLAAGGVRMVARDLAEFLVQLEIDAGAPGARGPIDVLQLRRTGQPLIQSKPDCLLSLKP
jgi:hypothetical protein